MRLLPILAVSMLAAGCAAAATDPLTDGELIARATAVMSVKEAPPDRMLGIHKGVPVIVDVRCGDVCPQYTVRIIHYAVEAGAPCRRIGGDDVSVAVPVSIAVMTQRFCVPHALFTRKLYFDHPYGN